MSVTYRGLLWRLADDKARMNTSHSAFCLSVGQVGRSFDSAANDFRDGVTQRVRDIECGAREVG